MINLKQLCVMGDVHKYIKVIHNAHRKRKQMDREDKIKHMFYDWDSERKLCSRYRNVKEIGTMISGLQSMKN